MNIFSIYQWVSNQVLIQVSFLTSFSGWFTKQQVENNKCVEEISRKQRRRRRGVARAPGLGKTTITVRRATTAAAYMPRARRGQLVQSSNCTHTGMLSNAGPTGRMRTWELVPQYFDRLVKPIRIRRAYYACPIRLSPPNVLSFRRPWNDETRFIFVTFFYFRFIEFKYREIRWGFSRTGIGGLWYAQKRPKSLKTL